MHRTFIVLIAFAMMVPIGCTPDNEIREILPENPNEVAAEIEVNPVVLEFGQLNAGQALSLPVTVSNVGTDTLYLEEMFIEGPMSFTIKEANTSRILAENSSTTLTVNYSPFTDETASGLLHIMSNDYDEPDVTVELRATGLAPVIELNPSTWDFGDHEVGCDQEQVITIRNIGSAPLILGEVSFDTDDEMVENHFFNVGHQLAPMQSTEVTVYYEPFDELPDASYLYVASNDPANPEAMASFNGTAHFADSMTDEYEQEGNNMTDILWVIDNSGSMGDDQNSLATNFSAFLSIVDVLDIDYHLGVITTDSSYLQGNVPIMTPSTPDLAAVFADAVTVGTNGSGQEKGFQPAIEALTPPMISPGGPNDGFLRDAAGLRIIFVSDEAEQSPGTVTDYVNQFWDLKVNPDHVVLSAIRNPNAGQRYEQAAQMTGGLTESITNPNWVNTLSQLAWLSMFWQDTFELSQVPVEDTIEVEINHVPVYVGWSFDAVFNAVIFDQDYIPDTGDLVEINYNLLGDCNG